MHGYKSSDPILICARFDTRFIATLLNAGLSSQDHFFN
jgi:hypothetical protein